MDWPLRAAEEAGGVGTSGRGFGRWEEEIGVLCGIAASCEGGEKWIDRGRGKGSFWGLEGIDGLNAEVTWFSLYMS